MRIAENIDLVILAYTVITLFVLFASFTVIHLMIYRKKQRRHADELSESKKDFEQQLLKAQVEVQENIYRQIANELHDNVGQLLSTTKMLVGVAELTVNPVPEALRSANATLGEAIQEIRALSQSLDREWLQQFNFLENLQREVNRINQGGSILASINGTIEVALKADEQLLLFRIVQEAIQNAIRHAQPTELRINIINEEQLIVEIINNGAPLPSNFHGMGTSNMQQRARLFGGVVHWLSETQTTVTITIPIKQNDEN